jgi:hypothetical protein
VLGPDHPATLTTRLCIANSRRNAGDVGGALAAAEELLNDQLRMLGPKHPNTLLVQSILVHLRGEGGAPGPVD